MAHRHWTWPLLAALAGLSAARWLRIPTWDPPPGSSASCAGGRSAPSAAGARRRRPACPGRPGLFYIGVVNGGVWKTTDYGRTWQPIFDDQPTGLDRRARRGALEPRRDLRRQRRGHAAARPLDGRRHLPLDGRRDDLDAPRPARRAADPADRRGPEGRRSGCSSPCSATRTAPTRSAGSTARPTAGETFQKVLYLDEDTGRRRRRPEPRRTRTSSTPSSGRRGRGRGRTASSRGAGQRPLQVRRRRPELAADHRRACPRSPRASGGSGSRSRRATRGGSTRRSRRGTRPGIYRSDDAGESWRRVNADPRVVARPSDAAEVRVHPKDPDTVFVPTIVTWKSTDGGKTFTALRGAPGGDDYQRIWIDPDQPGRHDPVLRPGRGRHRERRGDVEQLVQPADRAVLPREHGQLVPLPRLRRPAGERVGLRRGAAATTGRSRFREWHPVGVEEYGYVPPDPLDPDVVYGGKLSRYDRRTGQAQNVSPAARCAGRATG